MHSTASHAVGTLINLRGSRSVLILQQAAHVCMTAVLCMWVHDCTHAVADASSMHAQVRMHVIHVDAAACMFRPGLSMC